MVASIVFSGCFFWFSTATSDQVVIQRYLCTRNARQARRSLLGGMIGDVCITVILGIVGCALLGFFLRHPEFRADPSQEVMEQADKLFPHFMGTILPPGISSLLVAAIFAAAMSSLDSGITAISLVLITDFADVFARGISVDSRRLLARARFLGMLVGLVAMVLSFSNICVQRGFPEANLFELGFKISQFFIAPLFVVLVLAFFIPFSTPAGAWSAIGMGISTGIMFTYWNTIMGFFVENPGTFSFLWIGPSASMCSFLAGVAVSAITYHSKSQATSKE